MASEKVTALLEEIKAMTVLELSELVHAVEEEFGVSAAAAVAVAAPCRQAAGCFFADCFRCYRKAPYYVIRTRKNPVLLFRKEPQYGVLNYIIQSYCRLFHGADFDNRTVRICRYRKGCRTADIQQYHLFRVGNRNLVKCVCFL